MAGVKGRSGTGEKSPDHRAAIAEALRRYWLSDEALGRRKNGAGREIRRQRRLDALRGETHDGTAA